MITIFRKQDGRIQLQQLSAADAIPMDSIWIDVESAAEAELAQIQAQLGIQLPSKSEVWKNHTLNRLYMENDVAYMTACIISKSESPHPETSAVIFILTPTALLTIRDINPTSFKSFSQRITHSKAEKFPNSADVLEGLLEEMITRVAHNSELVEDTMDALSHRIFGSDELTAQTKNPSRVMKSVLKSLGTCADLNSKINESLQSINRMLHFFKHSVPAGRELSQDLEILITDTAALNEQTEFAAEKITFLLDATLGMINVEQNVIIKMFSVMAVFFMPPTLVASLYGMNFKNMPELDWTYGYPLALGVMVLFAIVPYVYFKRRGWL